MMQQERHRLATAALIAAMARRWKVTRSTTQRANRRDDQ
ncbi:hypothetical protein K788_0003932 [Paraburkholderia caribensis MBA4]|uniref:Uncharacterized protein n=1 Tax=Paraburkholderia caribensis MBA4 TaxID=1323664 RepID=A0A0P0RAC6_9BURK|nr:hypothetical protein K788_0003932 [Paraburkholderia caribensis MBA4]